jgi:hypothetical protein
MELLKAAPDAIAEYLSFLVQFTTDPRAALQPYLTPATAVAGKVHGKLILFCALGVGVALAFGRAGEAIGMADDNSGILGWIARIGEVWLPAAVVLALFLFTAIMHAAAAAMYLAVGRLKSWMPLRSPSDSINAILGLASWFVPVLTLLLVALRVYALHGQRPSVWVVIGLVVPLDLAFIFYFVVAFATAHAIPIKQVVSMFMAIVVVILIAAHLLPA